MGAVELGAVSDCELCFMGAGDILRRMLTGLVNEPNGGMGPITIRVPV